MGKQAITFEKIHWIGILTLLLTVSCIIVPRWLKMKGSGQLPVSEMEQRINERMNNARTAFAQLRSDSLFQFGGATEFEFFQQKEGSWIAHSSSYPLPQLLIDSLYHSGQPVVWQRNSGLFIHKLLASNYSYAVLSLPLQTHPEFGFANIVPNRFSVTQPVALNPVKGPDGSTLFSIKHKKSGKLTLLLSAVFPLLFAASLIYLYYLYLYCFPIKYSYRVGGFLAAAILLCTIFKLLHHEEVTSIYWSSEMLWQPFFGFFYVGELLVISIFLLGLLLDFCIKRIYSSVPPVLLSALVFGTIGSTWWLMSIFFNWILYELPPVFLLDDLYEFSTELILKIILLITWLFIHFVSSQHLIQVLVKLNINRQHRLYGLAIGVLFSTLAAWLLPIQLGLLPILMITLLQLLLWDLFIDHIVNTLTWSLIWLVFYTITTAGLTFKSQIDHLCKTGWQQAEAFAKNEDLLAQKAIRNYQHIMEDQVYAFSFSIHPQNEFTLNQQFFATCILNDKYFQTHYSTEFVDASILPGLQAFENSSYIFSNKKYTQWLLKTPAGDSSILLRRKTNFTAFNNFELRNKQHFQSITLYDIPIHSSKALYLSASSRGYNLNSQELNVWYAAADGKEVVLNKAMGGYFEPLSIFSLLFILMLLSVYAIFLLSSFKLINLKADYFSFKANTISLKMQSGVIGIILLSFLLIVVVSISFLGNANRNELEEREGQEIQRLINKLGIQVYDGLKARDSLLTTREFFAERLPELISIYDTSGQLLYVNDSMLLQTEMLPKSISNNFNIPFWNGPYSKSAFSEHELRFFKLARGFPGGIAAIVTRMGDGFNRTVSVSVSEFLGKLMIVYVFMLVVAGIAAIVITNVITQPIEALGDNLSKVTLGKNEPIEWHSEDEIGQLIRTYNGMLEKLEEQTLKLKTSEREEAWREMAKQVAHEIKNPLTPMKLNVQYLMHIHRQTPPEDIGKLLSRISRTLIEQIDSLSRIATEFSNFAKMPKAQFGLFSLNELIQSIYDLYKKQENEALSITAHFPEEDCLVRADREQLSRVLSNLIKNAIQAIPENRKGAVNVHFSLSGTLALIKVTDNGTGIPEHLQEKVFAPNFTTKSSGTGLGLAISKNIIEAHSGRIYFDTRPNEGTDFYIELPYINARSKTSAARAS